MSLNDIKLSLNREFIALWRRIPKRQGGDALDLSVTQGKIAMADEQRADIQRLQPILDEPPFDFGLRIVCIGDTAGKVFDHLRRRPIEGAELILVDAHSSPLQPSDASNETNASTARNQAPLALDQVAARIVGAKLVVIVACLGDVTAELTRTVGVLSRATGAVVIALVTTGPQCIEQQAGELAERELEALENAVDVLIHVPMSDYRRMATNAETHAAIEEGVSLAVTQAVRALLLPLTDHRNLLGVDFYDLREVFRRKGKGAFAVGSGYGDDLGTEAILAAVGEEGLLVGGARK